MGAPNYVFLYHGTTLAHAETIKAEGFRSGYLTQSLDQAEYYAQETHEEACEQGQAASSKATVLVIKVPVSHLEADLASIENPLTMIREKHDIRSEDDFFEALDEDEYGWPDSRADWQRGLFLTDSVFFNGAQEIVGEVSSDDSTIGFSDFDIAYPDLQIN